jgi:hypothetical protein
VGVVNLMFPVLPGKEEAARAWAAELNGPRYEGWDALQRRGGLTRETLVLQTTPAGTFLLAWAEGDIEKAMTEFAAADDEFTVWHRQMLAEITGIDFTQPGGAPPKLLVDWRG